MLTIIYTNGYIEHTDEKSPPIQRLHELVGGYIEIVPSFTYALKDKYVIANEDGMRLELEPNYTAMLYIGTRQLLLGNIVIADLDDID